MRFTHIFEKPCTVPFLMTLGSLVQLQHCMYALQMQASTAEAKAQFDAAELQLQNLLYEKEHYLKEIKACRSFR